MPNGSKNTNTYTVSFNHRSGPWGARRERRAAVVLSVFMLGPGASGGSRRESLAQLLWMRIFDMHILLPMQLFLKPSPSCPRGYSPFYDA